MKQDDPRQALQQGISSAKVGRKLMARMQLEQVVATHPDLSDAWLWLGWTADSPEQAIGYLQVALEHNPSNELARRFLDVASDMNQFELALPSSRVRPPATSNSAGIGRNANRETALTDAQRDTSVATRNVAPNNPAPESVYSDDAFDYEFTDPDDAQETFESLDEAAVDEFPNIADVSNDKGAEQPGLLPGAARLDDASEADALPDDGWESNTSPGDAIHVDAPYEDVSYEDVSYEDASYEDVSHGDTLHGDALLDEGFEQDIEEDEWSDPFAHEEPDQQQLIDDGLTAIEELLTAVDPTSVADPSQKAEVVVAERCGSSDKQGESDEQVEFAVPVAEACVFDEEFVDAAIVVDSFDPQSADDPPTNLAEDPISAPVETVPSPPPVAERTVLTVDDSPTVRMLIKMTLEAHGIDVQSAENGAAAIAILEQLTPGLILVDDNMPEMDGYKLCKWIKAREHLSNVPVLMMSDNDGVFDKLRGKFVGCNECICKPFESAELLRRVESYINAPATAAQ